MEVGDLVLWRYDRKIVGLIVEITPNKYGGSPAVLVVWVDTLEDDWMFPDEVGVLNENR